MRVHRRGEAVLAGRCPARTNRELVPSVSCHLLEVTPFGVLWAIIQLMTSPFRYNKKQRRNHRKHAKAEAMAADKLANKGMDPQIVAGMRRMAEINTKLSLAKRRKKKPENPK